MVEQRYLDWRQKAQDGDAIFFCRIPLLDALANPGNLGGYFSNLNIAIAQYPGSEGSGWHNFIHTEILYWADELSERRLKCAGFSAQGPTGLNVRFASERLTTYPSHILYLPLCPEARAKYDPKKAAGYINSVIGMPYGWRDLGKAVLPFWLWPASRRAKFCSQFVFEFYVASGCEDPVETCWDNGELRLRPARGFSKSPMELIMRPRLWDWQRAMVL